MTGSPQDGPVRGPGSTNWLVTAWVMPLAIAVGITVLTGGFGAITIAVAIIVGLVATALHVADRRGSHSN